MGVDSVGFGQGEPSLACLKGGEDLGRAPNSCRAQRSLPAVPGAGLMAANPQYF
jgi:hypothetical protein